MLGQDWVPCGIQRKETATRDEQGAAQVIYAIVFKPSSHLNGTISPRIFPPRHSRLWRWSRWTWGRQMGIHTRSGQSERSLHSSGEPQAPVGLCFSFGVDVSLVTFTEEYMRNHGMEFFRQLSASPFERDALVQLGLAR